MTFIIEIWKDILFNLYVHANIWINITRFLYIITNNLYLRPTPLVPPIWACTSVYHILTPKCQLFPHPHQVFL